MCKSSIAFRLPAVPATSSSSQNKMGKGLGGVGTRPPKVEGNILRYSQGTVGPFNWAQVCPALLASALHTPAPTSTPTTSSLSCRQSDRQTQTPQPSQTSTKIPPSYQRSDIITIYLLHPHPVLFSNLSCQPRISTAPDDPPL
ncbi:hypothetical protein CMEL01_10710 [Colletotrichum melonis]|uniref:Uncharacterized protein n=2 Tax=Colletotrichum acutatum species complex TaxID=2707335 RepID=A0AAI9UXL3_9PEZI|nr:hypothetical protein CMEL01_10710 [Colletotrichum melonis]